MIGIELTPDRPTHETVELGLESAEAGFDTVLCSHHYNNRDPFAALSVLAERTDEIGLGPGVTNPLETHPVTLASRIGTLQELSDGRAVFGLGPGDPSTLSNLGLAERRGLRPVLESLRATRRLLSGERIDHRGSFEAENAGLNYTTQPVPIYVGGEGPGMCRMAAKHAEGLLYNGSHPADLAWARERVEEGKRERPETRGDFELVAYASVSVAEEGQEARSLARRPVAFIAAGAPPPVLDRHGLDHERAESIGDAIAAGEFSTADGHVSEAMIDAFSIAGDREAVERGIRELLDHADGFVAGSPLGPNVENAIAHLGAAFDGASPG